MSIPLFTITRIANRGLFFSPIATELGFGYLSEIDRFIFSLYAKAIKEIPPADRLRGAIFVVEPAAMPDGLGTATGLKTILEEIQAHTTETFYSIRIDLSGGLSVAYACTPEDQRALEDGGWSQQIAQQYSRIERKCVVWAMGVGVHVYLSGDLYLSSIDVIEKLAIGTPGTFQNLSWADGGIVFEFARHRLNDTTVGGVWHLPKKHILRPKPEVLIRSRLGEFLQFRLAGYLYHAEEALVEHEGRADVSLHLIDGRILIVEVKWIGCSLVEKRIGATEAEIKQAIANNEKGWLTKFGDTTITSGIRQLVSYYKTRKYRKAYLTIFDCSEDSPPSCYVDVPVTELDGHNPANFRILRACVDPRSASRRART